MVLAHESLLDPREFPQKSGRSRTLRCLERQKAYPIGQQLRTVPLLSYGEMSEWVKERRLESDSDVFRFASLQQRRTSVCRDRGTASLVRLA